MKITLCSSAIFFPKLNGIKKALEENGHEVFLPSMTDYHYLEETALAKIQHNLIRNHFEKINNSDAILVANFDKNNVKGYIGGSALMEMAKAFDKNIPIYLINEIPQVSYREEIIAMQPIIIGTDWDKIK